MYVAPVRREDFSCWLQFRSELYSGLTEQFHAAEMEWIFTSVDKACFLAWASDDVAIGLLELSLRNIVDGCVGAPVGYIEGMYLRPDQRGRGLSRQLLEHAEQWFRAQGCRDMATDTELENIAAQEFFRHAGFEETYRIVEFRKPLDAEQSCWTPLANRASRVSEVTLFTRNVPGVTEFYRRLADAEPVYADAEMSLFRLGAVTLLIHAILEHGEGGLPFEDHFALAFDDPDAACAALASQGVQFEHPLRTYTWGRSAYVRDPDGRLVEITARKE